MDSGTETSDKVPYAMPVAGGSWNQETPRIRSLEAMGSGADISREVFDGMSRKGSRLEFDAGASPWAGLHPDILGVVLRLLPCLADRASVRSVCRHWRAGSLNHALPPPLPLLVLPKLRFSSLSVKGELTPPRHVPVPKEVEPDDIRCVGTFGDWLVGVTPSKKRSDEYYRDSDGECFLVNVFFPKVIRLPQLSSMRYNFKACSHKTLRLTNGLGEVHFSANDLYTMSFYGVVLSASPDSGSKYIVVASSNFQAHERIALWQPGMMSWHVCSGVDIEGPKDLTFFQGKLYVLLRYRPRLFAFELEEDADGLMVSRVQCCFKELPHDHSFQGGGALNLVVWRGELLLIVRHYDDNYYRHKRNVLKVEVFALDTSTNPYGLTKIHSFSGDCVFVGPGGCKSFPASMHDGVEGDPIYFVPDVWKPYDTFVYSMTDGRMRPFAAKVLPCDFDVPEENLDFPVWLFPSE